MTEREKILDRVRKLLALSESRNVNESATAAAQAQKLMTEHNISQHILDATPSESPEEVEPIEDSLLWDSGTRQCATWKWVLAKTMCEVNQCKYYGSGGTLRIVGRPSDADCVRYLYSYVTREIDRLTREAADQRGRPGQTWCNNFRHGAVNEVNRRLREADEEARRSMRKQAYDNDVNGTGTALVLVNDAIQKLERQRVDVQKWADEHLKLRKGGARHSRYNREAREAGKRAGANIDLSRGQHAGLGSGKRQSLPK